MNPEIEKAIANIQKQIDDLRQAADVEQTQSIRRRILQDIVRSGVIDNTLTDINDTTTINVPDAGGTFNVFHTEQYDRRALIYIDNVPYYIGLYNVS